MAYELITERNMSEGMQVLFQYPNDITTGLFMNLFIACFFLSVMLGLYYKQKSITGSGDIPQCAAVAGFSTSVLTIILRLVPDLISSYTLAVVIAISSISVLWFLFSND